MIAHAKKYLVPHTQNSSQKMEKTHWGIQIITLQSMQLELEAKVAKMKDLNKLEWSNGFPLGSSYVGPIHEAVRLGSTETLKFLLDHTDVTLQTSSGYNALMCATFIACVPLAMIIMDDLEKKNNKEIMREMITAVDTKGRNALDIGTARIHNLRKSQVIIARIMKWEEELGIERTYDQLLAAHFNKGFPIQPTEAMMTIYRYATRRGNFQATLKYYWEVYMLDPFEDNVSRETWFEKVVLVLGMLKVPIEKKKGGIWLLPNDVIRRLALEHIFVK